MPDLSTRRDREAELAAALMLVFDDWRPRFSAAKSAEDISWKSFHADIKNALTDSLSATALESGLLSLDSYNPNSALSADPQKNEQLVQRATAWAEAHAANLSREIVDTTRVAVGLSDWEPWLGQSRAEAIAVTETSRAITAGAAAAIGLLVLLRVIDPPKAYWATEADADVCDVCSGLDGEPEEVWQGVSPGGPPAHPHCRCWLEWR